MKKYSRTIEKHLEVAISYIAESVEKPESQYQTLTKLVASLVKSLNMDEYSSSSSSLCDNQLSIETPK